MQLLIFDFDGTLADTGKVILLTLSQTLTELHQKIPPEAILKSYIGMPLAKIFENICATRDQKLVTEAVRIYRARFPGNSRDNLSLYPGVRHTLKTLADAGLTLAIASSREKSSLLALCDQLGITGDFAIIAGEQDVQRHKPEPDIANFVLAKTGIPNGQAMFIGDTAFDIAAGNSAGMKTCGVTYGNQSKEELRKAGADYIIDRFQELPALIQTLKSA